MLKISTLKLSVLLFFISIFINNSYGQVNIYHDDIEEINTAMSVNKSAARIAEDPTDSTLYYSTLNGTIYEIDLENSSTTTIATSSNHNLSSEVMGFTIGNTGNFYLVGTRGQSGNNIGVIVKGVPSGNGLTWSTLAESEPYPAGPDRDHKFNAIVEGPDGEYVYVNSGSRTDHGEEDSKGYREIPITSCILKLPVSGSDITIPRNENDLAQYKFADGVRNTWDLAFNAQGELFGVENGDTRDNHEELNWIKEDHHYGFPWRIGIYDNPQQFEGYDPPDSDNLLVVGINMESTFHNDPDFPDKPEGVTFTDPVLNEGPDSDKFRDPEDGQIKDASEEGVKLGSFTPHGSPLALDFDTHEVLGGAFKGKAISMTYNSASQTKFEPFGHPGEDLLLMDMEKNEDGDNYEMSVTRVADGFSRPIDNVIAANGNLYIIETGGGRLYEVSFKKDITSVKENINRKSNTRIYPVPASNIINIESNLDFNSVSLFSSQGQKIKDFSLKNDQNKTQLNVNVLDKGIYFLKITFDNYVQTEKIIIE